MTVMTVVTGTSQMKMYCQGLVMTVLPLTLIQVQN